MSSQQDLKRRCPPMPPYKLMGLGVSRVVGRQWKKHQAQLDKQEKKTNNQSRIVAPLAEDVIKNNPKLINFRNLKDTVQMSKKQISHTNKNTLPYPSKPSTEYFNRCQNGRLPQDPHGISININIQNMLPSKQTQIAEGQALSDRGLVGEQKKGKKNATNTHKFDDFQCSEQLTYHQTPREKKAKVSQRTIQKIPLLERKHLKSQVHVKVKQKQKSIDYKQAIKKFESQVDTLSSIFSAESVSYLNYRQLAYLVHPHYIEKCQKNFTWKMRATLIEWMIHVSYQFSMKRQTFYLAANLVDLYLSKQLHLHKSDFQLTGAAAMFIASKLQQFQPKSSEQFAKATNTYLADEVKQVQKKICKTLKYSLNPPTLYTWANRFMLQWDTYLQLDPYAQRHPLFATHIPKYFKKSQDDSYKQYRTLMQLLDFATLDIQTVQYQPRLIVCAFMYLVLGKQMADFKLKDIIQIYPRTSTFLLDDDNLFNDLFMNFLQTSFNIVLIDLLPTVQYCATYFILPFNYDEPITSNEDSSNIVFSDFCSSQTYNPNMKLAIGKRFRGIYD